MNVLPRSREYPAYVRKRCPLPVVKLPVCPEYRVDLKALRCLCVIKLRAVGRFGHHPVLRVKYRVHCRDRSRAYGVLSRAPYVLSNDLPADKRPYRIVCQQYVVIAHLVLRKYRRDNAEHRGIPVRAARNDPYPDSFVSTEPLVKQPLAVPYPFGVYRYVYPVHALSLKKAPYSPHQYRFALYLKILLRPVSSHARACSARNYPRIYHLLHLPMLRLTPASCSDTSPARP